MVWHIIFRYIGLLSKPFRDAFKDLEKVQMGIAGSEEAWRDCVYATDKELGSALGAMYIRTYFAADNPFSKVTF